MSCMRLQTTASSSVLFVSGAAAAAGVGEKYGLSKMVEPVKGTRSLGKKDMVRRRSDEKCRMCALSCATSKAALRAIAYHS